MTERFLQVAVIGVITVLLSTLLKKKNGESALLLTLAACAVIALLAIKMAEPVLDFLQKLREIADLDTALMTPLVKSVGIGLLTQICGGICDDAGESAIAKLVELCGGILAVYVSLPLLEALLETVETMGGGG